VWFKRLDKNKDGQITYEEFISHQNLKNHSEQRIKEAYNKIDTKGTGFIDEFEWTFNFVRKQYQNKNKDFQIELKDIIIRERLD